MLRLSSSSIQKDFFSSLFSVPHRPLAAMPEPYNLPRSPRSLTAVSSRGSVHSPILEGREVARVVKPTQPHHRLDVERRGNRSISVIRSMAYRRP